MNHESNSLSKKNAPLPPGSNHNYLESNNFNNSQIAGDVSKSTWKI